MSLERIRKKAYCFTAKFNDPTQNMQDLIAQALLMLPKISDRKEATTKSGKTIRTISYHKEKGGMLCGTIITYERGKNQLALFEDEETEQIKISQILPPVSEDGKRQEFLDGILHFTCTGNHIMLIQSSQLRARQLSEHFGWLVRKTGQASNLKFTLEPSVSAANLDTIRKNHAKEIILAAPLVSLDKDYPLLDGQNDQPQRALSEVVNKFGIDRLSNLLPDDFFGNDRINDALKNNIECKLSISYKRSVTEPGHQLMDALAIALRTIDNEEVDCSVRMKSGAVLRGEELRLHGDLELETNAGVIDPDTAFVAMCQWLKKQIEIGVLEI